MLNEDYQEMLHILSENEVKFLIVGAYALSAYGYPRATGDIDIWVEPTPENSRKLYRTLKTFGAPLHDINPKTFENPDVIFQIGIAPRRIDIITGIDGVDFEKAYNKKKLVKIDSETLPFISMEDLIRNKRSTGRERDRIDADFLDDLQNPAQ